jgi:hypothetical protein
MGTTFEKANDEIQKLVMEVRDTYHPELKTAGVTANVLMVYAAKDEAGEPKGPALKHGGYPAAATISITGLAARALDSADVLIKIDGDLWQELNNDRQIALIDHEWFHIEPVIGDEGLERDDLGRPRLKSRKHDWQLGGFNIIAERHGENSFEYVTAKDLVDRHGKQIFACDNAEGESKEEPNGEPTPDNSGMQTIRIGKDSDFKTGDIYELVDTLHQKLNGVGVKFRSEPSDDKLRPVYYIDLPANISINKIDDVIYQFVEEYQAAVLA